MLNVFLSPHADDAAASCGGTIHAMARLGQTVLIYTLFAGDIAPPYSALARSLHQQWGNPMRVGRLRRCEDAAAVSRLGAELRHGELPDAIYRVGEGGAWLYECEDSLFGSVHPAEFWIADQLSQLVQQIVEPGQPAVLYAPLGIGRHVDHLIAFEVGARLLRRGLCVLFYEDFPYAADPEARALRLGQCFTLKAVTRQFSLEDLRGKVEAFSYYRSQIPMLFGTEVRMRSAMLSFARNSSGEQGLIAERYWSLTLSDERAGEMQ